MCKYSFLWKKKYVVLKKKINEQLESSKWRCHFTSRGLPKVRQQSALCHISMGTFSEWESTVLLSINCILFPNKVTGLQWLSCKELWLTRTQYSSHHLLWVIYAQTLTDQQEGNKLEDALDNFSWQGKLPIRKHWGNKKPMTYCLGVVSFEGGGGEGVKGWCFSPMSYRAWNL